MKRLTVFAFACVWFGLVPATVLAFGGTQPAPATDAKSAMEQLGGIQDLSLRVWDPERKQEVQVQVFSAAADQTPLAAVEGESITLRDFRRELVQMHSGLTEEDAPNAKNFQILLDRLVTVRLIEAEARNIGFDQTPGFTSQVDSYAETTLINELLQKRLATAALDPKKVDNRYRQISLEADMDSLRFNSLAPAEEFVKKIKAGEKFEALAVQAIADKAAEGSIGENKFIKLKELRPRIAQEAFALEIGQVSQAFQDGGGVIVFQLKGRRFVEDPAAEQEARRIESTILRNQIITDYMQEITDQYVVYNKETRDALDFEKLREGKKEWVASDAFAKLEADQRLWATVKGSEPVKITVAAAAQEVKGKLFHGVDRTMDPAELNQLRETTLNDKLFKLAAKMEAKRLGIDKSSEYIEKVENFSRMLLFKTFVEKVIAPEVTLNEEDLHAHYEQHQEDYMNPAMVKLKSLAFHKEEAARKAMQMLQRGSDFRWVSANVEGLVKADTANQLTFDRNILSVAALPKGLEAWAKTARSGNVFLYSDPGQFHYVLFVEAAYPPTEKPFEQVRGEVSRTVYNEKVKAVKDRWVADLKGAYDVSIYLREK